MGHKKRGLPPAAPFIRPPRFDMPVAILLCFLIVACLAAFIVASPRKPGAPRVVEKTVVVPQPYPVYIIKPSSGGAHVARYHSHHRG